MATDKKTLIQKVAEQTGQDQGIVSEMVETFLEEIYESLKQGESVSLRNFGTFYVRPERQSWVFKFSASQRLRKLFGWSSTYKGKL
jgi:DNA-binding protein HU-beta